MSPGTTWAGKLSSRSRSASLRNPVGTPVSPETPAPGVLTNEGFREEPARPSRQCQTTVFRFSETVLGIAFSQVYGYDEFRKRGQAGQVCGRPGGTRLQFRSLTDGIDTTTPAGRFFFHVMASLAQMERELLAERTRAGLDAARRRGRVGGRKRRMTPGKVESARKLLRGGMAPREIAQNLGVSIPTLYRWLPASSR